MIHRRSATPPRKANFSVFNVDRLGVLNYLDHCAVAQVIKVRHIFNLMQEETDKEKKQQKPEG